MRRSKDIEAELQKEGVGIGQLDAEIARLEQELHSYFSQEGMDNVEESFRTL